MSMTHRNAEKVCWGSLPLYWREVLSSLASDPVSKEVAINTILFMIGAHNLGRDWSDEDVRVLQDLRKEGV